MTEPKRKFSVYVKQQQNDLGLTNAEIAQHVGTDESNFSKWKNDNKFSRECIPALAEILQMKVRTPEEVEANYDVEWRRPYHRDQTAVDATALERAMAAIDRRLAPAFAAMQKVPAITREAFRHMGSHDFLIATTVSVAPLIFRPPTSEEAEDYFESRVGAVQRGALFALFMPSRDCLRRLSKYQFAEMIKHDELTAGWANFHRRLCERLSPVKGGGKPLSPKQIAHTRAQCFQCDDLPLTALGWTVSLLGLQTSAGRKDFRVLVRCRFPDDEAFLMLPRAQHGIEQWMRQFVAATLDGAERSATGRTDQESRWRVEFIKDLRDRMRP